MIAPTIEQERQPTTSGAAIPPRNRIEYLDGLRAIAALWVVLSHTWIIRFGPLTRPGLFGLLTNWLVYSHFAVDVFIVLSGFCLILPVIRPGAPKLDIKNFYFRRARRILPPYYCALALGVFVTLWRMHVETGQWHLDGVSLLANLFLVQDALIQHNIYNGPLWSVAVEWRIYFLFPLIVAVMQRYSGRAALGLTALIGYALTRLVFHFAPVWALSCAWYVFLFGLGAYAGSAAYGVRSSRILSNWRSTALISAVVTAIALYLYPINAQEGHTFGIHMPLIDCAVGILAASCLIGISRLGEGSAVLRILSWPKLVFIGGISYSLYLIHMPMLLLLNCALLQARWMPASLLAQDAVLFAIGFPTVLATAYLFYRLVELPFLRKQRRMAECNNAPRSLSRLFPAKKWRSDITQQAEI